MRVLTRTEFLQDVVSMAQPLRVAENTLDLEAIAMGSSVAWQMHHHVIPEQMSP